MISEMIFESKLNSSSIFLPNMFQTTLACPFALNIRGDAVSDICLINLCTYVY